MKALDLITHLNDFHNWTRQRTAAWVASVEPCDEEQCFEASTPPALANTETPAVMSQNPQGVICRQKTTNRHLP